MLKIVQKLLEISLRLCRSEKKFLRVLGEILGFFSVRYSKRMEKRLFEGNWDPVKHYRRKGRILSKHGKDKKKG